MTLKSAFNVLLSNFKLVYKMLIYLLAVGVIFILICYVAYIPMVRPIFNDVKDTGIIENAKMAARRFVDADEDYHASLEELDESIEASSRIIAEKRTTLRWAYVLFFVFFAIGFYFFLISLYAVGDIIHRFMKTRMKYNLVTSMIDNIKPAAMYSLASLVIIIPFNALLVLLIYWTFILLSKLFGILSLPLTLAVGVTLFAIKYVFVTNWLPIAVSEKKNAFSALWDSIIIGAKNFGHYFSTYWIAMLTIFACFPLITLVTAGLAGVVAIPTVALFLVAMQMILYFDRNRMSYYITLRDVIKPLEMV